MSELCWQLAKCHRALENVYNHLLTVLESQIHNFEHFIISCLHYEEGHRMATALKGHSKHHEVIFTHIASKTDVFCPLWLTADLPCSSWPLELNVLFERWISLLSEIADGNSYDYCRFILNSESCSTIDVVAWASMGQWCNVLGYLFHRNSQAVRLEKPLTADLQPHCGAGFNVEHSACRKPSA